jgi:hypothetical protein
MHDAPERMHALLRAIESNTAIQEYMRRISSELQALMQAYALDLSMRHAGGILMPNAAQYYKLFAHLLSTATRGNIRNNASGSVALGNVLPVMSAGNVREQCWVLSNLLFKDPSYALMRWLLSRPALGEGPAGAGGVRCLNKDTVEEYSSKVLADMCVGGGVCPRTSIKNILCGRCSVQNRKIRRPRHRSERALFRLHAASIVPELSCRELPLVGGYLVESGGFLPWRTGHMQWELRPSSNFVQTALSHNQSTISGFSGHTDAMLTFARIFASFDMRCMTLVCVLWLCGCEHHSVYEVIATAREHGLPYAHEDAIDFAQEMLRSLSAPAPLALLMPSDAPPAA